MSAMGIYRQLRRLLAAWITSGLADQPGLADPSRSDSDDYCCFAYSDFAAMTVYWAHSDRVGGIRGIQWLGIAK